MLHNMGEYEQFDCIFTEFILNSGLLKWTILPSKSFQVQTNYFVNCFDIFFYLQTCFEKKKVRHKVKGKSTWFYKIFWGFFLSAWKLFLEFSDIPCSSNIMQDKMILTSNISKSSPSTGVTNLLTTSQNLYL